VINIILYLYLVLSFLSFKLCMRISKTLIISFEDKPRGNVRTSAIRSCEYQNLRIFRSIEFRSRLEFPNAQLTITYKRLVTLYRTFGPLLFSKHLCHDARYKRDKRNRSKPSLFSHYTRTCNIKKKTSHLKFRDVT